MAKMRSPIYTRSKQRNDVAPPGSKATGNTETNTGASTTTKAPNLKAKKKRVAKARSTPKPRCPPEDSLSESESEELMVPVPPRPLKAKKRMATIHPPTARDSEPQVRNEFAAFRLNPSGFTGPAKKKIKVEVVDLISSSSSSSVGESFSDYDRGKDEQESTTAPNDEPKKDEGPEEEKERINFMRHAATFLYSMFAGIIYVMSLLFGGFLAVIIALYLFY